MKKIAAALALTVLLGVAHAVPAVALVELNRVALASRPTPLTPDRVRQAIVSGGAVHGWTVAGDEPGKVRLKYNKQNRHEVVVDVSYDATGFLIRYVASSNMKYEVTNEVPMIHPFYNRWVDNLSHAISADASRLSMAE